MPCQNNRTACGTRASRRPYKVSVGQKPGAAKTRLFQLADNPIFILLLLTQLFLFTSVQSASAQQQLQKPYDPTQDNGSAPAPRGVPEQTAAPAQPNQPASLPMPSPVSVAPQAVPRPEPVPSRKRIFPAAAAGGSTGIDPLSASLNSTTLKTGTDSTTLQTGANNTTLQVGTQSTTLQTGTDSALLKTGVERQAEQVNILFIIDSSRSMLESLEPHIQKIDAAKQVLQQALSRIPPDVNLGLRVFGQGYAGAGAGSMFGGLGGLDITSECRNTALWVPIGKGNRRAIIERVRELKPYGMTPLAYALAQAAFSDFKNCQGSKVIILISDGADTCSGDPCTVIRQLLPKYGIKIKVDVVGLSMHRDAEGRNQLNCVAQTSGGKYFDAKTAADLIDSVAASVTKAIEGRVIVRPSVDVPGTNPAGGSNPVNGQTPQDNPPSEPLKMLPR